MVFRQVAPQDPLYQDHGTAFRDVLERGLEFFAEEQRAIGLRENGHDPQFNMAGFDGQGHGAPFDDVNYRARTAAPRDGPVEFKHDARDFRVGKRLECLVVVKVVCTLRHSPALYSRLTFFNFTTKTLPR